MNSAETIVHRQKILAYNARFERRERRANNAMKVICQFRDTNSKDAGWVEDDNQAFLNELIKNELNDEICLSLGIDEEWTDEVTNLTHVLEKIKALESSFEKAKTTLSVLKKKAQKAKRAASQIVTMSYSESDL